MALALQRGRAASPVRPGIIVKKTLMGEVPLITGEYVHEAAITDLYNAYRGEVDRVNSLRPKIRKIRGMRRLSFFTMFRFAQLLRLVELVREEPMLYPPPKGNLLRIEMTNTEARIVVSSRKIFRLTTVGEVDEKCWSDLTNAWKEGWEPGQPLEYIPPTQIPPAPPVPSKPAVPKKPVAPPTELRPYVWVEFPSLSRFRSLLKHLYDIQALGVDFPGVRRELNRLSGGIGDWIDDSENKLKEAEAINAIYQIERYTIRIKLLSELSNLLSQVYAEETKKAEVALTRAISTLEDLVRGEG